MASSPLLPEEQKAERFLKTLELEVQSVPTSASKTPEFIVDGDARGYVVEVKARKDAEEWTKIIKSGQVAEQERSLGYGRWVEDVARNALKQFRSVDVHHSRWWVLWLAIRCKASAEAMLDEAIGSLFGVRQVVYQDFGTNQPMGRNCLFATVGVFEKHPEIVASIVDTGTGFSFCVNDEFAPDFDSFQQSVLWSSFARFHAPMTGRDLADNQGFFRMDRKVNRKDDDVLQAYIQQTYGIEKAIMLDVKTYSASIVTNGLQDSTT